MPRIGLEIPRPIHERLKAHAKRHKVTQGEVVEGLMLTLTDEQVDEAMKIVIDRPGISKHEARALRSKVNRLGVEKLKEILDKLEQEKAGS